MCTASAKWSLWQGVTRMLLGCAMILLFDIHRSGASTTSEQSTQHPKHITRLLDSLINNYNKYLRPGFGGPHLVVTTNILIKSMGPISEERMMFSMDSYFRQFWRDPRLQFTPIDNITELRPSITMLDKIWKPDTFFLNGQGSYLHTVTYSNKLFRIKRNGDIVYSQRLTIKSKCPMHLQKYPLDSQNCPLIFGSYAYNREDVRYKWDPSMTHPVKTDSVISMAQFRLIDIQVGNKSLKDPFGFRSTLNIKFHLRREIGYYLLQIYLPC